MIIIQTPWKKSRTISLREALTKKGHKMITGNYTDEKPISYGCIEINTPTGKIKAVIKYWHRVTYGKRIKNHKYDIYILDLKGEYVFHKRINIRPLKNSCKNIYETYMQTYEDNKQGQL
jgi:hypothetical protein